MEQRLRAVLEAYLKRHAGMRQRGPEWRAAMAETVGGSEIAAVMGRSSYDSLFTVAAKKALALRGEGGFVGGPACWWGSLLQDAAAAVVAAELGGRVEGDDICVREAPGHRNSPDGFIVARLVAGPGGPRLWTTAEPPPEGAAWALVLLEFKCPISRLPSGRVPRHYVPQLWSGLAVSPAAFGLFVDAVFRKCALEQLGPGAEFDEAYHGFREAGRWAGAYAWGLAALYAPAGDAEARALREEYFGMPAPDEAGLGPVDLGDAPRELFHRALALFDRKALSAAHAEPCFADGRGGPLGDEAGVDAEVGRLGRAAPPGARLFAVLPWKLLELELLPVARRPGFLPEVAPLIAEVHRLARLASAEKDPRAFLQAAADLKRAPRRAARGAGPARGAGASEAEVEAFFDGLPEPEAGDPAGPERSAEAREAEAQELFDSLARPPPRPGGSRGRGPR